MEKEEIGRVSFVSALQGSGLRSVQLPRRMIAQAKHSKFVDLEGGERALGS